MNEWEKARIDTPLGRKRLVWLAMLCVKKETVRKAIGEQKGGRPLPQTARGQWTSHAELLNCA